MSEEAVKQEEQAAAPDKPALSEAQAVMAAGDEPVKAADAAKKKGKGKSIPAGIAFVRSTFNNTLVTITDPNGDVLCRDSAGTIGFKGSRKSTPFAAQRAAEAAATKARKMGLVEVEVRVNGPGSGRESAITSLQAAGLKILSIADVTPIPHNGCRPRKKRRV